MGQSGRLTGQQHWVGKECSEKPPKPSGKPGKPES